jgi:hypothetical protein
MISADLIHEVRRLLEVRPELSQREIARMTGVSRATIGSVASGRRPDYLPRVRDEVEERPQGPPERCRGCGGLVYMPCRLCRVREIKAEERERALRERNNPFVPPRRVERDRVGVGERMTNEANGAGVCSKSSTEKRVRSASLAARPDVRQIEGWRAAGCRSGE